MKDSSIFLDDFKFSREAINQQLDKIFLDPFFMNSDILRKFLSFIVEETLSGHANWLKEYTIGVNVLNKSTDFKPQDNSIVRIHAGRLRRALHNYYNGVGAFDSIQISIPKGRYVPVFTEVGDLAINQLNNIGNTLMDTSAAALTKKAEVIAVLPFQHFHNNVVENSLVEGVGLQLTNALMQFENYSVVAYYTMRDLWKKTLDIAKLASVVDARYIISGNIQNNENKLRSHIQVIDAHSGIQAWSCMYEGDFAPENIFKLQDDIVQFIISELTRSGRLSEEKTKHNTSLAAVA